MTVLLKAGLLSVFFSQALASPIGQPSPAWYGPRPHGCKCGVTLFLRQPTKCQKEPSAYPQFPDIIANRNSNSTDRIPHAGQCHDHNGCYNYESFACPSGGCIEFDPCEGCRLNQPGQGPQDFSLQGPGTQIPGPLDLTQLQDFDLSRNGGAQDQGPGGFQSAGPKGGHRQGKKPKVVELEVMYEHSLSKVETWSELSSEPEPKERPPCVATKNSLLNNNFEDLQNPLAHWISIPPAAVTVDMQTVGEPAIGRHSASFILTPLTRKALLVQRDVEVCPGVPYHLSFFLAVDHIAAISGCSIEFTISNQVLYRHALLYPNIASSVITTNGTLYDSPPVGDFMIKVKCSFPPLNQIISKCSPHAGKMGTQGQPMGQPVGQQVGQPMRQTISQPVGGPIGSPLQMGQPIGQFLPPNFFQPVGGGPDMPPQLFQSLRGAPNGGSFLGNSLGPQQQQEQQQQMQIPPVGPVTAKVFVDDIQLTQATPPQGQPAGPRNADPAHAGHARAGHAHAGPAAVPGNADRRAHLRPGRRADPGRQPGRAGPRAAAAATAANAAASTAAAVRRRRAGAGRRGRRAGRSARPEKPPHTRSLGLQTLAVGAMRRE